MTKRAPLAPGRGHGEEAQPDRTRVPKAGLIACAAVAVLLASCSGTPATHRQSTPRSGVHPASRSAPRVRFGIIPTGGSPSELLPELRELSGGKPLLLHLYVGWRAADGMSPPWLPGLQAQLATYGKAGFDEEVVLRYESARGDVAGYAAFAAALVKDLAPDPRVTDLQVTNEADSPLDRAASDGGYPGASQALVEGIEEAHDAAVAIGSPLRIGFNVATLPTTSAMVAFFGQLWHIGGPAFASDVGFVGLDIYPGTYFPPLPAAGTLDLYGTAESTVAQALQDFRSQVLPAAHIPASAHIEITEIGFATSHSWHHTDAEQALLVRAFAAGACSAAARVGLSAFEWFDLTDASAPAADLSAPALHLPWRFGLLRSDLQAKPAFATYRKVIARGC